MGHPSSSVFTSFIDGFWSFGANVGVRVGTGVAGEASVERLGFRSRLALFDDSSFAAVGFNSVDVEIAFGRQFLFGYFFLPAGNKGLLFF